MRAYRGDIPIAVHPGAILLEMLEENNVSQAALARHLKVDPSKINEICKGKRGISAPMAILFGRAFGLPAGTWMNLQKNWELSQVDPDSLTPVERLRRRA